MADKNYLSLELEKLIKYAQGLGLKVIIKPEDGSGLGGGWTTDGEEIILYKWKGISTTQMIMNLLHELGHHMSFVYDGRVVKADLENALMLEGLREGGSEPIDKSLRKLIYESEKRDGEYRLTIFREVNLKIPEWKLKVDIELDNAIYKHYYQTGDFPTSKWIVATRTYLNIKYKERKIKFRGRSKRRN